MRSFSFKRFCANQRGNIFMMFGLSLPIFVVGAGIAIDYARAANARTKLYAAADAAALAAVTPAMMNQSNAVAQAAMQAAWNAEIASINGITNLQTPTFSVTTDPNVANKRNVTITYTAQSNNMFASIGIINMPYLTIGGQIHANATQSPNIDFYVLLDNSPSMQLPQTTAGIATMNANTTLQGGGCALACHQAQSPNSDTAGNPYYNPTNAAQVCPQPPYMKNGVAQATASSVPSGCVQMDNYALARSLNIPLRMDNLTAGMSALLQDADTFRTASQPQPNYSFTVNTMNSPYAIGFTNLMPRTVNTYSAGWASAKANLAVTEMWSNGNECATVGSDPCGGSAGGNDVQTNYDDALSKQNAQITTPGNGSATSNPQAVLFIVTDGVEDELLGGSRKIQAINANGAHNYCTDIKNKGVTIVILYTTYLPLTTNSFYNSNVAPFQPNIASALQACATSPSLFYQAQVGEDLGAAFGVLFQNLTAHLGHLTSS